MQSNKQQQRKTINLKAEWKVQKNGYQDDLSTNDFPNSFQHFLHHWIVFTGKSLNCEIFQSLSIRAKLTSGKNQFNVTLLFKHLFMLVWQYAIAIALPDRLLFTVSIDSFVHIVRFCFLDLFSVAISLSLYTFFGLQWMFVFLLVCTRIKPLTASISPSICVVVFFVVGVIVIRIIVRGGVI